MEDLSNKPLLREKLKNTRAELSPRRREEASQNLLTSLLPALAAFDLILSFASFGNEIDTSLLNLFLARTDRLFLPRVGEHSKLEVYQVTNPSSQLIPTAFGLYEPNPTICKKVDPASIQIVLVPALGFDTHRYRLGYGRGIYDRFLSTVPHVRSIGIGFKEQLVQTLPVESTDVCLEKLSLF